MSQRAISVRCPRCLALPGAACQRWIEAVQKHEALQRSHPERTAAARAGQTIKPKKGSGA